MPKTRIGRSALKPTLSFNMLRDQLVSRGISKPMLLLLNILLFALIVGSSMTVIGSQAEAGSGLTQAQVRQAKQTAAAHFRHRGNICNHGRNIQIRYVRRNWPQQWGSVDSISGIDLARKEDSRAYSYWGAGREGYRGPSSTWCKVWFNDSVMREDHGPGKYPYLEFCKTLTHEVGHLAGYTYKSPFTGKRHRHNVHDRLSIMFPYWSPARGAEVKGCYGR